MALKHKIFHGVLWAGGAQVLSMGCSFLLTIVLARGLPPHDYGLYFIALNTVAILVNVGNLGMDRTAVRLASVRIVEGDWQGLRRVLLVCFLAVLVGSSLLTACFFFGAGGILEHALNAPGLIPVMGAVALWLFFATLQGQLTESFRGLNDIRLASIFGGVRSNGIATAVLVCGGMAILAFAGELTLARALWVMVAVAAAVVLVGLGALRAAVRRLGASEQSPVPRQPRWEVMRVFREAWPFWLAMIVMALRSQGGAWLAGGFDTPKHVALYGVAQRLQLLLAAPLIIGNAVLPPIIAQLHAAGQMPRLERVIRSVSGLILLPEIALTLMLFAFGDVILGKLFGQFYMAAFPLLLVLCAGQLLNIATGAWQMVLPMTGNQRLLLLTSAIALVIQVGLGVILGSQYGVMGIAVSVAAGMAASNMVGVLLVRRSLGIWTYASLDRAMIGDAVAMVQAKLRGQRVS